MSSWKTIFEVAGETSEGVFAEKIDSLLSGVGSRTDGFFSITCEDYLEETLSTNYFFPYTHFGSLHLEIPTVTVTEIEQISDTSAKLVLETNHVAVFAHIATTISGFFSDNGMIILPGDGVELLFTAYESFTVKELLSTLEVKTLADAMAGSVSTTLSVEL